MADPTAVTVPNVVGLEQTTAVKTLTSAGLTVGSITTVSSADTPTGSVTGADPAPGTLVSANSAVSLQVSSGPAQGAAPKVVSSTQPAAQVAVPDVVGLTRTAAGKP